MKKGGEPNAIPSRGTGPGGTKACWGSDSRFGVGHEPLARSDLSRVLTSMLLAGVHLKSRDWETTMTTQQSTFPASRASLLLVILVGVVVVLGVLLTALMGPAVGNVFSNIVDSMYQAPAQPTTEAQAAFGLTIERLIIRSGSLTLVVEDTRLAHQAIEQMVTEMEGEGAFVVSSNERESGSEGSPYITMSIRVPATRFEETIDLMTAMAVEVHDRTESAQDVTEEYVDLDARLEALGAARDRLLEIMEASSTTEELLLAEQHLAQREAEIESITGRMQYLSQSARLSNITIELWPYLLSQPVDTRWRPAETVRRSVDTLLNGLRGFADFLIFFSIARLPWLLLFGGVGYGVFRLISWRRAHRGREKPEATPR